MTKKKENPLPGGRPLIPQEERVVPLNMRVKPKTKKRFEALAKKLKLSKPKTLERLLDKHES